MALKEYPAIIKKIENQSDSVRLFTIEYNDELEFKAGQFVNLSFEENGEKYMKPYSIASNPIYKNSLQLSIKLVPDGRVTPKLWNKKEGEIVTLKGPFGLFTVRNKAEKLVFIGTGTGVAPLRSMIQDLIFNQKCEKQITLIFGVRYENEILFKDEFEKLEKENPHFKYLQVVSKPTENWLGRTGHVHMNFESLDILNSEFYICGLPAMFDSAKTKLKELGADESQIYHEVFR